MSAQPSASASIDAPLDLVWQVMLDTASYGEWNPFVYQVECPSPAQVGDPIKLHVRWANGRTTTSPERITRLEHPFHEDGLAAARLSYEYEGLPHRLGLVHSVRHQWLSQEDGRPDAVRDAPGPDRPDGPVRRTGPDHRRLRAARRRASRQRAEALTRR